MLKINKKQSFTLIELLVSLGIISIVILLVVGIYVYVIGSREKTLGQTDLQQEGQLLDHEASRVTITLGDNDTGPLSSFTPSDGGHPGECVKGNEKCYRWKVLKLTVRPMNLGE